MKYELVLNQITNNDNTTKQTVKQTLLAKTKLSIADIVTAIESPPQVIASAESSAELDLLYQSLQTAGGQVTIRYINEADSEVDNQTIFSSKQITPDEHAKDSMMQGSSTQPQSIQPKAKLGSIESTFQNRASKKDGADTQQAHLTSATTASIHLDERHKHLIIITLVGALICAGLLYLGRATLGPSNDDQTSENFFADNLVPESKSTPPTTPQVLKQNKELTPLKDLEWVNVNDQRSIRGRFEIVEDQVYSLHIWVEFPPPNQLSDAEIVAGKIAPPWLEKITINDVKVQHQDKGRFLASTFAKAFITHHGQKKRYLFDAVIAGQLDLEEQTINGRLLINKGFSVLPKNTDLVFEFEEDYRFFLEAQINTQG